MTKEEAIKIFNTMLLIIKAGEQKISLGSVDEVVEAVKMAISSLSAEQTAEYFTFEELESWLFENALNNLGNVYGESVEKLISRLDGFKEFVKDRRVEQAEINHNSTENNDNDLVSRKAVIDMMNKIFFDNDFAEFRVEYGSQGAMYYAINYVKKLPAFAEQTDYSIIAKIKKWSELPEYSEGERNVMKCILAELKEKQTNKAEHTAESNEDLISRKAVIDGLASIAKVKAKSDAQKSLMGRSMFFVENLPSTENTASWVALDDYPSEDWECDNCGFIITGIEEPYRFCPNCVKKMWK